MWVIRERAVQQPPMEKIRRGRRSHQVEAEVGVAGGREGGTEWFRQSWETDT